MAQEDELVTVVYDFVRKAGYPSYIPWQRQYDGGGLPGTISALVDNWRIVQVGATNARWMLHWSNGETPLDLFTGSPQSNKLSEIMGKDTLFKMPLFSESGEEAGGNRVIEILEKPSDASPDWSFHKVSPTATVAIGTVDTTLSYVTQSLYMDAQTAAGGTGSTVWVGLDFTVDSE